MTTRGKGIELSGFALTALSQREAGAASELPLAISFYLADRAAERPGWTYPSFLPAISEGEEAVTVELDPELWSELAAEAERQGVPVDRLAAHAALYFAAELEAGRITERILEDLDRSQDRP